MKYSVKENLIIVRLDIDDEILESIKTICENENVKSAVIHAIGAVKSADIALFDFASKEYKENSFNEFMELLSLEGNVTKMNKETYIHLHASLGNEKGQALGGHLKRAVIGATCEMFIETLPYEIKRIKDEETGLNIFDI